MKTQFPPASAFIILSIILIVPGCRRGDLVERPAINADQPAASIKTTYMEGLRGALQREDRLYRQLTEHAAKLDIAWPYSEAIRAARLRMMKIEAVLRENNIEPRIVQLSTAPAGSIEDALKKDAALLEELDLYYMELSGKNIPDINPQIIAMLEEDVRLYRTIIEYHDGVPPDKLKGYAGKKYKPRDQ